MRRLALPTWCTRAIANRKKVGRPKVIFDRKEIARLRDEKGMSWSLISNWVTATALPLSLVPDPAPGYTLWVRRCCLLLLLAFCLVMPSDWTQDVPARYGKRHPGLGHSVFYPPVSR